jgi:hypothetical protein
MKSREQDSSSTGQFALACEKMNEFARSLRLSLAFESVRTGADIRYYETSWRLEKWVEAEIDGDEGTSAAWWLEFGPHHNGWVVRSHVAVSPDIFFAALEDRVATSPEEVGQRLSVVVDELKNALQQDRQFADAVEKTRRAKPRSVGNQ